MLIIHNATVEGFTTQDEAKYGTSERGTFWARQSAALNVINRQDKDKNETVWVDIAAFGEGSPNVPSAAETISKTGKGVRFIAVGELKFELKDNGKIAGTFTAKTFSALAATNKSDEQPKKQISNPAEAALKANKLTPEQLAELDNVGLPF